jgi:hypothetical protein
MFGPYEDLRPPAVTHQLPTAARSRGTATGEFFRLIPFFSCLGSLQTQYLINRYHCGRSVAQSWDWHVYKLFKIIKIHCRYSVE